MSVVASQDRRCGRDRRRPLAKAEFPLIDSDETLVRADRRKTTDRRITNIYVEDPNIITDADREKLFIWSRDKIHEIYSTGREFWLGRSVRCNEHFPSRYVSRRHAKLYRLENRFYLADDSRNGTYVKVNDGEYYLKQDKIALNGSGIISLGVPFEKTDSDIIHFFRG